MGENSRADGGSQENGNGSSVPSAATSSTAAASQQQHLNEAVNSLDPLNAMEKSLNDQMPHTPNTPHTPGNGGSASHPMTPIGGPPSVNNGPGGNHSPQQHQNQNQHQQHSMNNGEGCATNTGNNQGLNLYEPDLTTELGFIDGNAESDLNVSRGDLAGGQFPRAEINRTFICVPLAIAAARDQHRCDGAAKLPGPQPGGSEYAPVEWLQQ